MSQAVARGARTVGLFTAASRILGMIRDVVVAHVFGASKGWDAFVIAFQIPNLFRHLFGEGALTSAFLPSFVGRIEKEGKERANTLFNAVLFWLLRVLSALTLAGIAIALLLSYVVKSEGSELLLATMRITMPYLLLICTTAIISAALNGIGHFATPAAAPVVLNVVFIVAAFVAQKIQGDSARVLIMAWAAIIGGVAQLVMQVPSLYSNGLSIRPSVRRDDGLGEVLRLVAPAVIGLAVVQLNELLDNVIAKACISEDGAVSALYYANRLGQLPLAIIGVSIATASLPVFSSTVARGDEAAFRKSIVESVKLCLFIAIPATIGLIGLSREITKLLFEGGKFDLAATDRTAAVVRYYAIGIPFFAVNFILTRAFYALKDTKTPVRVSLMTVGLNLVLNLALVWPLKEGGIALATSITGIFNLTLLLVLLKRKQPAFDPKPILVLSIKSVLLSYGMLLACLVLYDRVMPLLFASDTLGAWKLKFAARVTIPIAVSVMLYFLASLLVRIEEAFLLFRRRA